MSDSTKEASVQALKEFVRAAEELSRQWPEDGSFNEGYPDSLPSFDELVDQLGPWLQAVQRQLPGL